MARPVIFTVSAIWDAEANAGAATATRFPPPRTHRHSTNCSKKCPRWRSTSRRTITPSRSIREAIFINQVRVAHALMRRRGRVLAGGLGSMARAVRSRPQFSRSHSCGRHGERHPSLAACPKLLNLRRRITVSSRAQIQRKNLLRLPHAAQRVAAERLEAALAAHRSRRRIRPRREPSGRAARIAPRCARLR